MFGCRATSFALPALTTLPVFMSNAFVQFLVSLVVAFGLAFVLALFSYNKDLEKLENEDKKEN